MFDWDDLRLALAIARGGTLAAAAQTLGVNQSTVFRRLNALEARLGSQLFTRRSDGYRATDAGERLLSASERMEAEALALDRDLTGRDTRLSGKLRVTCSETLSLRGIAEEIVRFRERHPGILVELSVDNRTLDLSRREADLAIRALRPKEADLFGRKLLDIRWAIYGSQAYLAGRPRPRRLADLARHAVIGWAELSHATKADHFLTGHVPADTIGYRSSSLINQMLAARAGAGLALLPCYLADPEPGLTRAIGPLRELVTELWIVTHGSLKDTARVRSFMEIVGDGVRTRLTALVA